jgi:hypothetical protein
VTQLGPRASVSGVVLSAPREVAARAGLGWHVSSVAEDTAGARGPTTVSVARTLLRSVGRIRTWGLVRRRRAVALSGCAQLRRASTETCTRRSSLRRWRCARVSGGRVARPCLVFPAPVLTSSLGGRLPRGGGRQLAERGVDRLVPAQGAQAEAPSFRTSQSPSAGEHASHLARSRTGDAQVWRPDRDHLCARRLGENAGCVSLCRHQHSRAGDDGVVRRAARHGHFAPAHQQNAQLLGAHSPTVRPARGSIACSCRDRVRSAGISPPARSRWCRSAYRLRACCCSARTRPP